MPGLFPTTFNYDARGRLISTTTGSRTGTVTYDSTGYPDYSITPDDKKFDYNYDLYGYVGTDPINFIDPWGLIKLKSGISDSQLKDVIKGKYDIIDKVYKDNNAPEAVITSTNDSKHKKDSKHYENEAIDLRERQWGHFFSLDNILPDVQYSLSWRGRSAYNTPMPFTTSPVAGTKDKTFTETTGIEAAFCNCSISQSTSTPSNSIVTF